MPHEKTGLESKTPWLPRPAGTPRQGSRQGPAKGPALTSLPLEWISTSTGTLGPLFGEKERQRGDGEAGGRREQKKRQMFFPGSRGPSRLSASQDPLQRIRFEQWDPHGTLPGTPCECAQRVLLKPPLLDRSCVGRRSQAEAVFFIGAAAASPASIPAMEAR